MRTGYAQGPLLWVPISTSDDGSSGVCSASINFPEKQSHSSCFTSLFKLKKHDQSFLWKEKMYICLWVLMQVLNEFLSFFETVRF